MPLITAVGRALSMARTDDTAAVTTLLRAAIDHLDASEVRVMVAADQAVETWTLRAGELQASLAVELDVERPGGMDAWFSTAAMAGRSITVADLPSAPGYEYGLVAAEVAAGTHALRSSELGDVAVLTAALVSAARADVERRIAESALFRVRRGA